MQYIDYMPRKIAKQNDTYFEEEEIACLPVCRKESKMNERLEYQQLECYKLAMICKRKS